MGPLYVPQTLGACNESTTSRVIVKNTYPLNAAFLNEFHQFREDTKFLPDWKTSKFKFDQLMTREAKIRMDLN